jgi:hypothetical protein
MNVNMLVSSGAEGTEADMLILSMSLITREGKKTISQPEKWLWWKAKTQELHDIAIGDFGLIRHEELGIGHHDNSYLFRETPETAT